MLDVPCEIIGTGVEIVGVRKICGGGLMPMETSPRSRGPDRYPIGTSTDEQVPRRPSRAILFPYPPRFQRQSRTGIRRGAPGHERFQNFHPRVVGVRDDFDRGPGISLFRAGLRNASCRHRFQHPRIRRFRFQQKLLEPTVIETVRGGGVVESNLNAYTDSLHGYASLDLTGPGFAGISMLAKIRTTVITRTAPEFPPLAPDLIIGANTAVSLHELRDLGDVRYTLSYNLSTTAFPGEGDFNVANRGGLLGCTQTEDTVCSTFLDYDTAETSFRLTPEQPIVYDTFLRYAVTLETLAVAVDEPASASLIILPLALIGLPAMARRRLTRIIHQRSG
jgi:hypothetical protein